MWHELVLHGIGGRTIAEAKENMLNDEFLSWADYIRKRGSLNWGLRLESGFGLLAAQISAALGGKAKISDFTPHIERREATGMTTPEEFMRVFGGG